MAACQRISVRGWRRAPRTVETRRRSVRPRRTTIASIGAAVKLVMVCALILSDGGEASVPRDHGESLRQHCLRRKHKMRAHENKTEQP